MHDLPNPTTKQVELWLKYGVTRDFLHSAGWQEVNRHYNGITRAARPYIQANYTTAAEQEAAFDGLTLALSILGRFEQIQQLSGTLLPASTDKGTAKPGAGEVTQAAPTSPPNPSDPA